MPWLTSEWSNPTQTIHLKDVVEEPGSSVIWTKSNYLTFASEEPTSNLKTQQKLAMAAAPTPATPSQLGGGGAFSQMLPFISGDFMDR